MQLKPINQQVVAVVGASSGIGRLAALEFARQGAKVVVSARGESKLNSLVEEIRDFGGDANYVVADVKAFEQVKVIADKTVDLYGRLDTWVHGAAIGMFATFDQITPAEFQHIIDVNLMGQVFGAMAALPHLKREGRGALIHISSMEGRRSLPYQSPYSSAKHGVEGFLEAMRLEPIFRMSKYTHNFAFRRSFCQNQNFCEIAKTQVTHTLQAFYHLWGVIEIFQAKQTKIIDTIVNKLDFDAQLSCDRRMHNRG